MNWKFFVGASILTVGLGVKFGAPVLALAAGIALAGLASWRMARRSTMQQASRPIRKR